MPTLASVEKSKNRSGVDQRCIGHSDGGGAGEFGKKEVMAAHGYEITSTAKIMGALSQRGLRGWWFIILRWAAALVVLGLLLHFLPVAPLRAAIARVPVGVFFAVLVGYLLAHCIGVLKWRMVVNAAGAELDFSTSAQCYAGGLFGTPFLPSSDGGDVVRLAVGLRRSPRPAAVLTGNLVDRFLDVASQGGLLLVGLLLAPA